MLSQDRYRRWLRYRCYLSLKVAAKRCVFSLRRETGRLFTARTMVGSLFQMFSTDMLKVRVRDTWSRGGFDGDMFNCIREMKQMIILVNIALSVPI